MQKKKSKSQIARENGKKSKGPITPQGKQISAQNSLRHGFTSHKAVLLANESEEELRAFSQIHFDHYLPINEMEAIALEEVIAAAWRIRRLWHTETTLIDVEIARQSNYPCPIEPVDSYLRTTLAFQALTATPAIAAAAQAVNQTAPHPQYPDTNDNQTQQQQGGANQLLLLQRYARSLAFLHTRALHNLQTLQANRPNNNNDDGTRPPAQPNEPTQPQQSAQPPQPQSPTAPAHPRGRVFLLTPTSPPVQTQCQAM
jgi:hypothetical protein